MSYAAPMSSPTFSKYRPEHSITEILEGCMDGEWHLVKEYTSKGTAATTAHKLRAGEFAHLVPGRWKFRSGQTEEGYGVWAKWLG